MKALVAVLALLASPAFAQTSVTTVINGTGVAAVGQAISDVGGQTITLNIANGVASITKAPTTSPPGVTVSSFSAGLSVGAVLGSGFGNTGGTAGSTAGLLPAAPTF